MPEAEVGEALVGVAEATHVVSTCSPRARRTERRWLRVNVVLGKLIVGLLVLLAWKGFELVVLQAGSYVRLVLRRPLLGRLYQAQFIMCYCYLIFCFLSVYLVPLHRPGRDPPSAVLAKSVVFECTADGSPTTCYECDGAWRSIRSRHCRDCGVCQPGFDHHCPFMDACITSHTFKPFFCFLYTTLPLIGFAEIPLTPLQLRAVATVARSTWWTPSMHKDWWSHWYSWLGGPVWRYGIGLLLGYRRYDPSDTLFPVRDSSAPYVALSTPRLTPLLLVMSGWFVFGVAVAMIVTIVLNSRRGLSTVQVERVRRWKARSASSAQGGYDARIRLWVPLPREECKEGGLVLLVDPDVGLFDLGPRENWRRLMGAEKWWWWFVPWMKNQASDLDVNLEVLAKLQAEARKRST